ncbi:hypothetical protein [Arthrobacter antibioticus]|uniref:hypothetical protein n=1 Tax=Arthrobacter sp. H35-MC1 TaxID=3046203 RepID=UPI0024BAB774|nr:hypothetical protein [Arthrobacter sp. H35-MC1]MDJ0317392.1 hypothetical protein [Arthrobacter sp. H35-MC1]
MNFLPRTLVKPALCPARVPVRDASVLRGGLVALTCPDPHAAASLSTFSPE